MMTIVDTYTTGREQLLNRVLGIDLSHALNPDNLTTKSVSAGHALAAEIKGAINQFKAVAMNEVGALVDYQQLSHHPAYQSYRDLVSHLRDFDYTTLQTMTERQSFWINIYNTLVVDAVIQFGVKNSVIETRFGILSFFQKAAYFINGQRFSLTDIEHGVLRGNRGFPYFPGPHFSSQDPRSTSVILPVEPRIHFALNCASKSCPPIGVYTPEGLEGQLELAARNFIQGDLVIDTDQKQISISNIFRWYQVDFDGKQGIIDFLLNHIIDPGNQQWLEANRTTALLNFHPYDWCLNHLKKETSQIDIKR